VSLLVNRNPEAPAGYDSVVLAADYETEGVTAFRIPRPMTTGPRCGRTWLTMPTWMSRAALSLSGVGLTCLPVSVSLGRRDHDDGL
jgi:hypothetical protein